MTAAPVDDLACHVAILCQDHDIALTVGASGSGVAWRARRKITIPPVAGQVSYFTALHEIGHVIGPQPGPRLTNEALAWAWALDNALINPSPITRRAIARKLLSYHRTTTNGWRKNPSDKDIYWRLFRAMKGERYVRRCWLGPEWSSIALKKKWDERKART